MKFFFLLLFLQIFQIIDCKLKFVIEIFRHGARGPLYPYYNYQSQLDIMGQLTPGGKKQHYELGRTLRKEYINNLNFLSEQYDHQELKIFSTNVNRTIESVYSQLSGLYPQGTGPVIYDDLDLKYIVPPFEGVIPEEYPNKAAFKNQAQIFPIHTVTQYDNFLDNTCPDQKQMFYQNIKKNQKYYDKMQERFKPLMQKYSAFLSEYQEKQINLKNTNDLWDVFDNFMSNKFQEKEQPEILTEQDYKELELAASFEWFIKYGYGEYNKITTTEFFQFVLDEFDKKLNDKEYTYKYIMLSSHDTNIVKIMAALGLSNFDCLVRKFDGKLQNNDKYCFDIPTYASNFIFELHDIDNKNIVKIKYQGQYINICEQQSDECELEVFRQQRQSYMVENPKQKCGFIEIETQEDIEKKQQLVKQDNNTKTVLYTVLAIQLILAITLGVFLFLKQKEYLNKKKEDSSEITS